MNKAAKINLTNRLLHYGMIIKEEIDPSNIRL